MQRITIAAVEKEANATNALVDKRYFRNRRVLNLLSTPIEIRVERAQLHKK